MSRNKKILNSYHLRFQVISASPSLLNCRRSQTSAQGYSAFRMIPQKRSCGLARNFCHSQICAPHLSHPGFKSARVNKLDPRLTRDFRPPCQPYRICLMPNFVWLEATHHREPFPKFAEHYLLVHLTHEGSSDSSHVLGLELGVLMLIAAGHSGFKFI